MRLQRLVTDLPLTVRRGPDTEVAGVADDSRRVTPGSLFIARPGADGDALAYVPAAVDRGAAAVLVPHLDDAGLAALPIPQAVALVVADAGLAVDQRLVGRVAEAFYDRPSAKLKLIGITGTNGKTTTATLVQHLLNANGLKCGLIGTVALDTGSDAGPSPATLTTPGAAELSALFADMVANGCQAVVMEVSSHALHQGRADALTFAAAGFTNLTQDHLDYHRTMDAYADAKAVLFERLGQDATAVLNGDDAASARMAQNCHAAIVYTSVNTTSHAHGAGQAHAVGSPPLSATAQPLTLAPGHTRARFAGPWGGFDTTLPLVGTHNLANTIQALALAHAATGLSADRLRAGLETCPPVPGRLEPVGPDWPTPPTACPPHADAERSEASGTNNHKLPTVLVDYAHTPDALINVGRALKPLTKGKLITVFGCGGDRDRAKRPLMAKAAQRYADHVILTSDNSRTEDPQQILNDAAAGFKGTRSEDRGSGGEAKKERLDPQSSLSILIDIIPDRAAAIAAAIAGAQPDDTVLIAGKGHEDYQILGTEKTHFDDREQAAAALRNDRH